MPRSGCPDAGAGDEDRSRGGNPAAEELSLLSADVPSEAKPGSRGARVYVRGRRGSRGSPGVGARGSCGGSAGVTAGLSVIHRIDFRGASVGCGTAVGGAFGACFVTGGSERGEGVPWPRLGARGEFDLTERNSTLEHREHRNARPNGSSRT